MIAEKTIRFFDEFFEQIEAQGKVIVFVQQYLNSSRPKLKIAAKEFIDKWNYQRQ
ncbi:hypothetical protein KAI12_02620 [Candidatus Bathyarchaeota archaeon]|nr:hypothetical protein [Candidatus Bathyarchaeota archaeon]